MDLGIKGKAAIVIGGTSNLGLACARRLAEEKVDIFLVARDPEKLERTAAELRSAHAVQAVPLSCDITVKSEIRRLREEIERRGGADILLINSARPPMPMREVLQEDDDERWKAAYEGQLLSAVHLVRALTPMMIERKWGRIIGITSSSVKQPLPHHSLSTVYRAGLTGLLKQLSIEVAQHGVTVNCVCPASILTEGFAKSWNLEERAAKVPMKRLGSQEELSGTVAFLASMQAGFITGASLQVDGGLTGSLL